jgi:hypothetical protein
MTRRVIPMILVAAVALGSLVAAQDTDPGDGPVRLKKKNRDPEPEAKDPVKQPPLEPDVKGEEPGRGKDRLKDAVPEGEQPDQAQGEDPKEVLSRIDRNLKSVVDRLENNELNDATRQRQDDVLNDLESLIKQNEPPQGGASGAKNQSPKSNPQQNKDQFMNQQGNSMNQQGQPMNQRGNPMNQQGQPMNQRGNPMNQQGQPMNQQGNPMNQQGQPMNQQGNPMNQPGQPQAQSGTRPGLEHEGGARPPNDRVDQANREQDDGTWGLPEVLRAQMPAYQTRKNYSQRNRDLVDSYRRSLLSPGQDKGD